MNSAAVTPGWFSIPGAAAYTGFSVMSIRTAIELKKFPANSVALTGAGKKQNIRIRREDLDQWIQGPTPTAAT